VIVETEHNQLHSVLATSPRQYVNVVRLPAIRKPETYLRAILWWHSDGEDRLDRSCEKWRSVT
jgi:hypothetical protein